ncbi:transposase [Haloarcula japonica DSM 6131]|uniref:Transposase n=1 Tax=Haloarcula japonica (strain ATCC 49778 / DSM 6131 / JCM 7785 / NBRC 101032 / NCIMB 13157 / TR-1) TaxID=1227453 RepID=M0LE10_HALJT|nr:transposase [Haloarcula japonica DSM 6131]
MQKTNLQPESGKSPNQIAFDETVIRINDPQFWLYAAAGPQSNELLPTRLFATTTTTLTEIFCANFGINPISNFCLSRR